MSMNNQLSREIKLGERSHRLVFGKLSDIGSEMSKAGLRKKALILTHPRIMRLHGKALLEGLEGFKTAICEIPEGEETKSEAGLTLVYEACNRNGLERNDAVICFGGGVVGDLGGYAASNWCRGINIVQVPTTLIAQVDSSIGGKTGIDWHGIKNKIGAFKQPKLIFTDTSVLSTLSDRHFSNGMAEVIKYGLLNASIWAGLNARKHKILARDLESLTGMVWICANLKCDTIEQDEFDQEGIRAKLNLGHTIGHAIESASRFRMLHGEAVSIGLIGAARLSMDKASLSRGETAKLRSMLRYFGLPVKSLNMNKDRIIELMHFDKKTSDGKLRFVLIREIGRVSFPNEVSEEEVKKVLD
jgi:3-dehydroquinate synthase